MYITSMFNVLDRRIFSVDNTEMINVKTRIKEARLRSGLSQEAVGTIINKTKNAVSMWESHNSPNLPTLTNLKDFARAVGCSPAWLLSDEGYDPADAIKVPLIRWADVPITLLTGLHRYHAIDRLICPMPQNTKLAYALSVDNDSMDAPSGISYPQNTILYCDPVNTIAIQHGTYVIAHLAESQQVTFKQYCREDGRQWLRALNPSTPLISEGFEVVATVFSALLHAPQKIAS